MEGEIGRWGEGRAGGVEGGRDGGEGREIGVKEGSWG